MSENRFNKEAANWDSNPFIHRCSKEAFDAIVKHVPRLEEQDGSTLNVLEIGCGTGVLSFMVAPHVRSLTAVDTASGMIDVLTQKIKDHAEIQNIHPVCALIEQPDDPILLVPGGGDKPPQFDLIICHLTLHHIPLLLPFFKLLHSLLAPDGQIALTDYEDFGPEAVRFHPEAKRESVERHGIKQEEVEHAITDAGFRDVTMVRAFTIGKKVEDGNMDFPFLLCLGTRSA